uniref:HutD/Ves family protein n=1 Tax=Pararhizobium sp. IMCC3301 TaxID=3067904 RepID=UPI002740AFF4|nr:HutD family protein [Pararhizobium sp. IMCC3301]
MINHRFHFDSIPVTPWKNAGGVTRQIAKSCPGDPFWRLSIAGVEKDGPFSGFPGLHRILTVVSGAGMTLNLPDGARPADLNIPVGFSGDVPVEGVLRDGPVQNFNLIYEAEKLVARVQVGPIDTLDFIGGETGILCAVYCLSGSLDLNGQETLFAGSGILNPTELPQPTGPETTLALHVALGLRH